jgi:glycosyltransferase involved in cell wall biosynthesis
MVRELVSIIMPSFNSGRFLPEAIESVIGQTYPNWELIICDDGSTDESQSIIQEYETANKKIYSVKNVYNKGAPGARNSCLDKASGRYIAFLDSDDFWYPHKLEKQISFMEDRRIAFSYSYHDLMNEQGKFLGSYKAPKKVNSNKMKLSNFIPCLTAVYDTKVLGKVRQPDIKKRNDYALWLKILNSGRIENAFCIPSVTAKYRSNSYGLSNNKLDSLLYFRRCLEQYGNCSRLAAAFYACFYVGLVVVKKKFIPLYNFIVMLL